MNISSFIVQYSAQAWSCLFKNGINRHTDHFSADIDWIRVNRGDKSLQHMIVNFSQVASKDSQWRERKTWTFLHKEMDGSMVTVVKGDI